MGKIKIPKKVTFIIKLALTLTALVIVFKKIDSGELWSILKTSNPLYLILASALFILSKVISSFRLNKFLQDIGIQVSEKFNLKLYWLGMYYNLFLPGGIGGDGYKIYLLNKMTQVKTKSIFWAVLMDRLTGLIALFSLAAALGYYLPYHRIFIILLWLSVPVALVFFYFLQKIWFADFLKSYVVTNIQSFGVQIAQLVCSYFILKALHVDDQYGMYLFVFLVSSIVATIPFTVGGVGAREITFIFAAEILGLQMEPAVGLSFLFFFITAVVSLYGIRFSFKLDQKN